METMKIETFKINDVSLKSLSQTRLIEAAAHRYSRSRGHIFQQTTS